MSNSRNFFKNQDYNKIRNNCLKNNQLFEDEFFERDIPRVKWLRPKSITGDPRFLIEGGSRFDVMQQTSDCWLVAAMASLTMNKPYFQHVVPPEQNFKENYVGMFFFRIWQCGIWVEVVVDDRLPTENGRLKYAKSRHKDVFWSALLEKAYAKLYGSYRELFGNGLFSEAIIDFTGGIVEYIDIQKDSQNIVDIVTRSLSKGSFIAVFMTDDNKTNYKEKGLITMHTYNVTRIINYSKDDLSNVLVRLRNPWGGTEWKGAWSDASPEWKNIPEEVKKEIGLVKKEDGEFWMSNIDFTKHFQYMHLCHLSLELLQNSGLNESIGWEANYFRGEWIKGVNAGGFGGETFHLNPQYTITLTDTDDGYDDLCTLIISLVQKTKKRTKIHNINFTAFFLDGPEQYSNERLSKEYIKENLKYAKSSNFQRLKEVVYHELWNPGVYCIIPATQNPDEEGQYLLRVFSEKNIFMEESEEYIEKIGGARSSLSQQILKKDAFGRSFGPDQVVEEYRKSIGKTLLQKNYHEVEEFFNKITGDHGEIGWEELQLVLDYALGNSQGIENDVSTETGGIINTLVTGIQSWLTLGSWWLFKPSTDIHFSTDMCRRMIKMLDDDISGKLGPKEFKILWKRMKEWEAVFLNHCKEDKHIAVPELKPALSSAGYTINNCDLGRLARRYSDNNQQLGFDDFIMCIIEAETGWI